MPNILKPLRFRLLLGAIFMVLAFGMGGVVMAQVENPQSGSVGVSGTVPTDPPQNPATISFPTNGQNFTDVPINVTGLCPSDDLLVKLFKNEVFAGSAQCNNGAFTITIDLFSGTNILVARVYDQLDQAGPDSNTVTVTYDDGAVGSVVDRVTITTNFAKKGAFPGEKLTWPFTVAGGLPPYAISIDWGDGVTDLLSRAFAGEFELSHIYDKPGTYKIVIRVGDSAETVAFLQVVGVISGPIEARVDENGNLITGAATERTIFKLITWPLYILMFMVVTTFWLGRKYELKKLKHKLEKGLPIRF